MFEPGQRYPSPTSTSTKIQKPPFPRCASGHSLQNQEQFLVSCRRGLAISTYPYNQSSHFQARQGLIQHSYQSRHNRSPSRHEKPRHITKLTHLLSYKLYLSTTPTTNTSPLFQGKALPLQVQNINSNKQSKFKHKEGNRVRCIVPTNSNYNRLTLRCWGHLSPTDHQHLLQFQRPQRTRKQHHRDQSIRKSFDTHQKQLHQEPGIRTFQFQATLQHENCHRRTLLYKHQLQSQPTRCLRKFKQKRSGRQRFLRFTKLRLLTPLPTWAIHVSFKVYTSFMLFYPFFTVFTRRGPQLKRSISQRNQSTTLRSTYTILTQQTLPNKVQFQPFTKDIPLLTEGSGPRQCRGFVSIYVCSYCHSHASLIQQNFPGQGPISHQPFQQRRNRPLQDPQLQTTSTKKRKTSLLSNQDSRIQPQRPIQPRFRVRPHHTPRTQGNM